MGNDSNVTTNEWSGYKFRLADQNDYPAILTHLRNNFYLDEPMHQILGVPPDRMADMDEKIGTVLNLNHGTFYVHPVDQPEKVAAVLLLWYHEKGFKLPPMQDRSPSSGLIRKTIVMLKEQYDIHEKRGVDIYPELYILSTDREHRGKGLATELYRRAIAKVKSEGHKLVSSTFSNPFSRKIGEKLGFKPVARVEFNEVKKDDGSLVYGEAGNGHSIVETVLEL